MNEADELEQHCLVDDIMEEAYPEIVD